MDLPHPNCGSSAPLRTRSADGTLHAVRRCRKKSVNHLSLELSRSDSESKTNIGFHSPPIRSRCGVRATHKTSMLREMGHPVLEPPWIAPCPPLKLVRKPMSSPPQLHSAPHSPPRPPGVAPLRPELPAVAPPRALPNRLSLRRAKMARERVGAASAGECRESPSKRLE